MTEKKRVYNRIKAVMAEKRKTNLDLVKHLKKSKETISLYVRNEMQPPLTVMFDIADFLKCDVRDLIVSNLEPPTYTKE